tara:strand:- start:2011 stop:2154 length:144 start_codon:yes stop_codon:yes gene_type:complete
MLAKRVVVQIKRVPGKPIVSKGLRETFVFASHFDIPAKVMSFSYINR